VTKSSQKAHQKRIKSASKVRQKRIIGASKVPLVNGQKIDFQYFK
jgi:hypothetical protein